MQNITRNAPYGNLPGNRQISIAPTDEVKSIAISNFKTRIVILKSGFTFGKIEANGILFSCKQEDGRYIHDISCRLVSTLGKHDALFNRMKNKKWIVKIIDNNNTTWLSGSLAEPLHFSWEHIGEDKPSGEHAYRLCFGRECSEPLFLTDTNSLNQHWWIEEQYEGEVTLEQ